MGSKHPIELVGVVVLYFLVFFIVIEPAVKSIAGFEPLSAVGNPYSGERIWELVSNPQGWLLCLGYVLTHFTYLFLRARLAGESVEAYWE